MFRGPSRQEALIEDAAVVGGRPIARRRPHPPAGHPAPHLEAPYLEALGEYANRDAGRFHVPGHKGGAGAPPRLAHFLGDALAMDIPLCIDGIDIGAQPSPLDRAEFLAARTWGARRTWFLVNGASEASHVACLALAAAGGPLVMQRNAHSSTIHGLVLSGVNPEFVAPEIDDALGVAHCLDPLRLAAALDATPDAAAAFIVSPTYFGACADVRALADVCHERDVPLIVDEAWGAHFHFHDRLPQDALGAGADLVISGTHKLIGSLTQSAMLHLGGREWPHLNEAALSRMLGLVRSTSPSSLLLGSLDAARAHVAAHGAELLEAALRDMDVLKEAIREIDGLDVLGEQLVGGHAIAAYDPLRLAIDVSDAPCDGQALAEALRNVADINLELITERILIAHVGIAEPVLQSGLRLVEALRRALPIAAAQWPGPRAHNPLSASYGVPAMAPRDAFFASHEHVSIADAAGRVSLDSIVVYPPGIANVLPGERFTPDLVAYLTETHAAGGCVKGTWDAAGGTVRVLKGEPLMHPAPMRPYTSQPSGGPDDRHRSRRLRLL